MYRELPLGRNLCSGAFAPEVLAGAAPPMGKTRRRLPASRPLPVTPARPGRKWAGCLCEA